VVIAITSSLHCATFGVPPPRAGWPNLGDRGTRARLA
jgi:hypothetical protein